MARTLLVVKAKNIYHNTIKMYKTMETELSHYITFRNFVPRYKDVHWLHRKYYMDERI